VARKRLCRADECPKLFERDPGAGYLVMRRLASLITHHLTPAGVR